MSRKACDYVLLAFWVCGPWWSLFSDVTHTFHEGSLKRALQHATSTTAPLTAGRCLRTVGAPPSLQSAAGRCWQGWGWPAPAGSVENLTYDVELVRTHPRRVVAPRGCE